LTDHIQEQTMTADKAQELILKINETIAALRAETDAAKQSATFKAWLDTLSRFHHYSFGNCLLIAMQAPDATRVSGFNTWKALGRFVKKGEKAIRILAPMVRKTETDNSAEPVSKVFGYRTVSVFSYEQTEGPELPTLNCNATEGGDSLLPVLEQTAANLNIRLVYEAIEGAAEGYSKGGLIKIEESLETPARCGVILHEIAHELLHRTPAREGTTRQQRELEAEAVSYAVLAHYGIHANSSFYLATYEVTSEMLTASIHTIGNTAKRLIQLIDEDTEDEESVEQAA
jgi:hypothetical protein